MKKIVISLMIVALWVSVAHADWINDFNNDYSTKSLDEAVLNAVKLGTSPDDIVEVGLAISNLNPQNLIKALYCAGVNGQDIYFAAQKYNISEIIVAAGFKKSTEECTDRVVDTQPYTPFAPQALGFSNPNTSQQNNTFVESPAAP